MSVETSEISDLEDLSAAEVLRHVADRFGTDAVLACSFQKEETVLLDLLSELGMPVAVMAIDTGVLFPETYEMWRTIEARYGITIERLDATDATPWTRERCCGTAKVDALRRGLAGRRAWVTGLRREQSPTRASARKLEWDAANSLWKANPLADWDEERVWSDIYTRKLPFNPLHDHGYSSIGCAPCTLPGEGREGRWAGETKTECGIHVTPLVETGGQ